jgi:hypothetical protein
MKLPTLTDHLLSLRPPTEGPNALECGTLGDYRRESLVQRVGFLCEVILDHREVLRLEPLVDLVDLKIQRVFILGKHFKLEQQSLQS